MNEADGSLGAGITAEGGVEQAVTEDGELAAEQQHLDRSRRALAAMRERARALLDDLRAAGNPDLDYEAALAHRVNALADSPRPLLFGRIDEETGPSWHIGRRHVEDAHADPLVVDWRAPVAVPFYRAGAADDSASTAAGRSWSTEAGSSPWPTTSSP